MINRQNILIAGGTGLIGRRLSELLQREGHTAHILTRNKTRTQSKNFHYWDPSTNTIDLNSLPRIDVIINLAGAGVMDKSWSPAYKNEILESRLKATHCLRQLVLQRPGEILVLAASAIGYYGYGDQWFEEETPPAPGNFLQVVTQKWEDATAELNQHAARLASIRIGIVLSPEGGALKEMMQGFKLGFGSYFSPGNQYYSWIHIDDLCQMMMHIIQNPDLAGIFNGVAPEPVTAKELAATIARIKFETVRLVPVPGLASRMILGERHTLLTGSCKVSSKKIEAAGFDFTYPTCRQALEQILRN